MGEARGPFIAVMLLSIAAFGIILSAYTLRPVGASRAARVGLAPEPTERR
ncbi:hypothetical protein [Novosphingobium indicum]|nr:hypothetical protein [Novosphingobium indicum]